MGKQVYKHGYSCKLDRVVDGDTCDAMIDLGFNVWIHSRIRFYGVDTWESRTRDLDEKKKGLAAKARNKELLESGRFKLKSFGTGKFGRVLGEVFVSPEFVGSHITECIANPDSGIDLSIDGWVSVNDILIEEGHAYDYHGGKKKDFNEEIKKEKTDAEESIKDV